MSFNIALCLCGVLAIGSAQMCGSYNSPSASFGGVLNTGLGLSAGPYGVSSGPYGVSTGSYGGVGIGGLSYGSQGVDALSIATGSSYAPNGISVLADNLEIAGPVSVSGAYPILGAISFGGNLPTGGQGQVTYSTGSGVGLTSGGCGYGLPSAQPTISSAGINNYGLAGVSGVNNLLGVNSLSGLSNVGCGCGLNVY